MACMCGTAGWRRLDLLSAMPALPTLPNARSPALPLTFMSAFPFFALPVTPARLLDPITNPSTLDAPSLDAMSHIRYPSLRLTATPLSTPRMQLPGASCMHARSFGAMAMSASLQVHAHAFQARLSPRHRPSARPSVCLIPLTRSRLSESTL